MNLIYELEHGQPLPQKPTGAGIVPAVVAMISNNYNIAALNGTDPIGRLVIKP